MPAIVLSASRTESSKFIAQEGLGSGARHVVNKDTLPYPNSVTEIHVLPSYVDRRDFHAVEAAVRHLRRKAHNLETVEWVRRADGTWVRADDEGVYTPPEPPINPQKAKPENARTAEEIIEQAPAADRLSVVEDLAAGLDDDEDTSKDAVPGQISITEIADTQAEQLEAIRAAKPVEAYLEPEGFKLTDDPELAVEHVLKSAAGIPNDPVPDSLAAPAPTFPWDQS